MLADINALKNEFVGKTFGLLTIEDVFRDTLKSVLCLAVDVPVALLKVYQKRMSLEIK